MPVEIRELIIRTEVQNVSTDDSSGQIKPPANLPAMSSQERRELLDRCVEQVLQILEKQKER